MRPESPNCCRLKKWQWRHNFHHCVIVKFFDIVLFLLSSLITGIRFISISSLILDLWQFPFIKDWAEIEKSEILPSEFFQIYGDWGELGISSLARVSLIKKKKIIIIIIIMMIMIIKIIITIIINLFLCSVLIHMQRFTLRRGSPNILNLDFNVQSDIFNCCFYARTSVSSYMDNLW